MIYNVPKCQFGNVVRSYPQSKNFLFTFLYVVIYRHFAIVFVNTYKGVLTNEKSNL